jgi:hypothetical protein
MSSSSGECTLPLSALLRNELLSGLAKAIAFLYCQKWLRRNRFGVSDCLYLEESLKILNLRPPYLRWTCFTLLNLLHAYSQQSRFQPNSPERFADRLYFALPSMHLCKPS